MSTSADLELLSVDRIDGTEIIVEFSDSTWAVYSTQELADLRPDRQKSNSAVDRAHGGENGGQFSE